MSNEHTGAGTRAHTVPRFYLQGFVAPESEEQPAPFDPFVWVGSLVTGEIKRRSPKNISIVRGLYDGPGGFEEPGVSIETHLAKIENAASSAIRKLATGKSANGDTVPSEIWRFLAWQAARTPSWMELEDEWIYHSDPNEALPLVEPPPDGINDIRERVRSIVMENPDTGERCEVTGTEEVKSYYKHGWKWVLCSAEKLELLHMQAWYFQVRHFPRLSWVQLTAPENDWFITSDRGVSWIVDGQPDTPPAALRHPTAQVVAPLTRKVVLIGRNATGALQVTPREVNRFIACAASDWIVGPTKEVIELAIKDRASAR